MVGTGWSKKMKITKKRLLQIIREELELHEKYVDENMLELDEDTLEELTKEQGQKAIEAEIDRDKKTGMVKKDEDQIIDPKTKEPVNGTKPR
jgi:hypothetical protein